MSSNLLSSNKKIGDILQNLTFASGLTKRILSPFKKLKTTDESIVFKKTTEEDFKKYLEYRKKISDIDKLIDKETDTVALKELKANKKVLENELSNFEERFYNPEIGLWLGIAIDLAPDDNLLSDITDPEDDGYQPFLIYLEWGNLHNHFVVYGTSGYGKSRLFAVIMRQIMAAGWSLFMIDPKGGIKQEIAAWMYEYAKKYNREKTVSKIMASYPDLSDKLNPIFGMTDEEIASLCVTLISTGTGVESADEKFFNGQVYRIAFSILSSMRFLEKIKYLNAEHELSNAIINEARRYMFLKERKGLEVLYADDMFVYPDHAEVVSVEEAQEKVLTSHKPSPYDRTLITFKELAYYGEYNNLLELYGLIKETPIPTNQDAQVYKQLKDMQSIALNVMSPLISASKDRYNAVGESFTVLMSQLAYGAIGKIFCTIRVNPLRFKIKSKEGVITLFEPAPMRFKKVSEMMVKVFVEMFISMFGEIGTSGRGMHRRIAMLVDEAKPMVFPGIEEIYNKARSLGMTIGAFYQSKSDPKLKLGETLADIVEDNTATQIFMKQVSSNSQREVAESFGTTKKMASMPMTDIGGVGVRNSTYFETISLVEPRHIDELQIGEAYIRHYGKKLFVKFPYQKDAIETPEVVMPKLESELVYSELEKSDLNLDSQYIKIESIKTLFKEERIDDLQKLNPLKIKELTQKAIKKETKNA